MERSVAELGELEQLDERPRVRFTRRFRHSPEKVWKALTDREHVNKWFPTDIEGDWSPGAPLRFAFREHDLPAFDGEVVAYDPPSRLEFRWGDELLQFELQPDGDATVLTLRVTFDEVGKVARDSGGWHQCLDILEHALDGQAPPPEDKSAWKDLFSQYTARFGPETATIGPPPGIGYDE
jgi:uncharacterized protein YndB with AHSA1/START domain